MQERPILLSNLHLRDINPVQCGWHHCDPGHSFGPAVRDYYLLHFVISGRGQFISHGRTLSLREGQIFVIRPGETTTYRADEKAPWHYIWIGFECGPQMAELLREDVLHLPLAEPLFLAMASGDRLARGREWLLCGKIYELFTLLEGRSSGPRTRDECVSQAVTYLETEYMRDVAIADLAQRLNMSRSRFSVLFKAETGVSPQQYLTRLRMERAVELLTWRRFTVSETAAAVGYADVYTFSRVFKLKHGVSPTQYLRERSSPLE